jgi:hypothetical protein
MKKNLWTFGTFFVVVLLAGFAAPAKATTISFSNVKTGSGDITATAFGTNEPLLNSAACTPSPEAICNVTFQTLTISGAPTAGANGTYTPLFLQENFDATTNTLTIAGEIAGCTTCGGLPGFTTSTTLVTIVFGADLTGNAGMSTFSLNALPSITSITVNSMLAADLGDTGPYQPSSMTLTAQPGGAIPNYNSISGTLVLTDAVPEPSTVLLTSMGLGLIVLASRRRFSKAK